MLRSIVESYLAAKAEYSSIVDDRLRLDRSNVPQFSTPEVAVSYYAGTMGNPYTGDPLHGAIDYYTHPGVLQHSLENNLIRYRHIDCDDVALWYHEAVRACCPERKIVTLIDGRLSFPNMSHVICVAKWLGGWTALDTNGLTTLPGCDEISVCKTFEQIYKEWTPNYVMAVDTQIPRWRHQ